MIQMVQIKSLTYCYDTLPVLDNLSVDFSKKLNIIVGPNASGKTTLLKCIFGLLKGEGEVCWKGEDLNGLAGGKRRDVMVYLPQEEMTSVTLTAFEVTLLGRLSSLRWKVPQSDLDKTYGTLRELHIESLAERYVGEMSGGQKKLVSIAQTLVRDPHIVLMDEPTNSLDMQKQLELFDVIHQIIVTKNITFIIVMHDINLSCRHAEQLTVLDGKGGVYASGRPVDIVTETMLRQVYGVESRVIHDTNGIPIVSPLRSIQRKRHFTKEVFHDTGVHCGRGPGRSGAHYSQRT